MHRVTVSAACMLLGIVLPLSAQTNTGPEIRMLGAAGAVTTEKLASISQVHSLRDGRVLVNDGTGRRLLMFDSAMKLVRVVADSMAGSESSYGSRPGRLLPYRGDSAILVDATSLSMMVIDPEGNIARISATPRPSHITYLTNPAYGNPGIDAKGRMIYRLSDPAASASVALGGGIVIPEQPDSAPVLRLDLDTRKLDTAGMVKIQKRITEAYRNSAGEVMTRTLVTPMPVLDDWTVMSDGSIAFVRHRDYRVEWLNADGSKTSSPGMPFEWQRMTDEHKASFVDSVRKALEHDRWKNVARYDSLNFHCFDITPPERDGATAKFVVPPAVAAPAEPPASTSGAAAAADAKPAAPKRPANCPAAAYIVDQLFGELNVIKPEQLPDYKPPFSTGSLRADADGNLWIRVNQMRPVANTWLYDVVNRKGELFDRVRTSAERNIVGFAPGGIVFVAARNGSAIVLERVAWR